MSTTSDNLWRCDWTFAILCALAFFLAGVTATLVMCNTRNHQSELVTATRLVPRVAQQPILMAAADSRQQASASPIATATVVRVALKQTTYVTPVRGTYRAYTVQPGQTLSRLDPEGWQHTCEINKQSGSIKTRDCKITAGTSILLPVAIVIALSQEQAPQVAHLGVTQPPRAAERNAPLNLEERLRLAEIARQQFCNHPENERSYACTPERAAQTELQTLALMVERRRI